MSGGDSLKPYIASWGRDQVSSLAANVHRIGSGAKTFAKQNGTALAVPLAFYRTGNPKISYVPIARYSSVRRRSSYR
jgi:hypothetical protein